MIQSIPQLETFDNPYRRSVEWDGKTLRAGMDCPRPLWNKSHRRYGWMSATPALAVVTCRAGLESAVIVAILPQKEAIQMTRRENGEIKCVQCGDYSDYCACEPPSGVSNHSNLYEFGYRLVRAFIPDSLRVYVDGRYVYALTNISGAVRCSCPGYAKRGYCKHSAGWRTLAQKQIEANDPAADALKLALMATADGDGYDPAREMVESAFAQDGEEYIDPRELAEMLEYFEKNGGEGDCI